VIHFENCTTTEERIHSVFVDGSYMMRSIWRWALREKCQLVTADERLVNALASSYSQVVWIGDWP
jgi:hypothetical protein